jgi:3-oxoacyl-[acyl-carrier-protein] synthase-3
MSRSPAWHVDAPHTLTTKEINERLQPTLDRLGIRTDVLGDIAGIHARRLWDNGVLASDAATMAGRKALEDAGIDATQVGLLVNTSVSRDYLEPSTASIVSGNLGVSDECMTFDVANACLAFINGMDIAARMIERGDIDYALVVDGETANLVYEKTLERMTAPDVTADDFRNELAALTTGSGAAAMVMARSGTGAGRTALQGRRDPLGHRVEPAVPGQPGPHGHRYPPAADRRHQAGPEDLHRRQDRLGLGRGKLDQFVIHQVSQPHTAAFIKNFGIDPKKVMTIFGEHGNIGPASVPIVLSKLKQLGKLKKGDRIALLGIGSGLNCSMAEVVW